MQKNLTNELLAEKFIIKTVTRTENTNETRKPNAFLFEQLGVIDETKPMLVFGSEGEAITVWQTTYSIKKALHVPDTLREYDSMKKEVPEAEAETVSDVMESLREIYTSVKGGQVMSETEPDTNAAIVEELKKLNETIKATSLVEISVPETRATGYINPE